MKGWRTIIVGLVLALLPAALTFLAGVHWEDYGISTPIATLISGLVMMAMRAMTTTPVGRAAIAALVAVGMLGTLSACSGGLSSPTPVPSPTSVCADVAAVASAPDAASQLARLDPHSALGQLWLSAVAACPGGAPAAGVSTTWTQTVWAGVKQLIPIVLPYVVPTIAALL